jgi:hypothetical protein
MSTIPGAIEGLSSAVFSRWRSRNREQRQAQTA